jgi:hypothetical protein
VLAALPLLVEAEDAVAHALDGLAAQVSDPAAQSLREAAELRRSVDDTVLDRDNARHAAATWATLVNLASARVRLETGRGGRRTSKSEPQKSRLAVRHHLDEKIAAHVAALARIHSAADEARAAEVAIDDGPLRTVESDGESLAQVSRAIVEDV